MSHIKNAKSHIMLSHNRLIIFCCREHFVFFLPCIIDLIIDSGISKFFFAKVVFCELTYGSDGLRGKLVCSNLPALAAKWKMLFVRNIRNSVAYFVVYSTV